MLDNIEPVLGLGRRFGITQQDAVWDYYYFFFLLQIRCRDISGNIERQPDQDGISHFQDS